MNLFLNSKRIFIKDFKEGENVTVYGKISQVSSFQTKSNLTVVKVQIKDETKSFWLNFFYAKANKFLSQRYKSQFPVNSSIIISGMVKRDNYTGQFTIDKPQYQIIDSDEVFENDNLNLARIVRCVPSSREFKYKPDKEIQIDHRIIELEVIDQRNALERVLMHFAHFEKQAEKIDQSRYKVLITYDNDDETEMVIRILSFGPMVKVVAPNHFVDLIKDRLIQQKSCGQ